MTRRGSIYAFRPYSALLLAFLFSLNAALAGPLPTTTPKEAGLSEEALSELKALLEETNTRAALILHKGKIVSEWYWKGEGPGSTFEVWSTSKSYASTVVGMLIDEGKIESVDDHVSKYIPSWDEDKKAKVTIRHLLEQTSGLSERGVLGAEDQLAASLEAEIETEPGEVSKYNNAACNVISAIVSAAAGVDPEQYMREKMWKRIGMDNTSWRRDRAGNVITYAGIQSTARDLTRFGLLHLNNGKWDGEQIVSKKWIDAATTEQTRLGIGRVANSTSAYGFLWWLDYGSERVPHNYSSLGLYGNNMTVIPELDLVGVRLVGNDRDGGALMMRTPEWVEKLAAVVLGPASKPDASQAGSQ